MNHLRTIVVGYDGSSDAETAVRWTLHVASEADANVTVVHAVGILEHLSSSFSRNDMPPALLALARECGFDETHLHWLVDNGDPCSVLLRTSALPNEVDMLVVGSRGQGKRAGLLLGSTSLEVVEHATIPVVVVPSSTVEH
jgi:nucleotide-binding universal stress UspA family protein